MDVIKCLKTRLDITPQVYDGGINITSIVGRYLTKMSTSSDPKLDQLEHEQDVSPVVVVVVVNPAGLVLTNAQAGTTNPARTAGRTSPAAIQSAPKRENSAW
jgi:hypothetical protein